MKIDKDRLLFYIGTALLIIAIVEVTIIPYALGAIFPDYFFSLERHKTAL